MCEKFPYLAKTDRMFVYLISVYQYTWITDEIIIVTNIEEQEDFLFQGECCYSGYTDHGTPIMWGQKEHQKLQIL